MLGDPRPALTIRALIEAVFGGATWRCPSCGSRHGTNLPPDGVRCNACGRWS